MESSLCMNHEAIDSALEHLNRAGYYLTFERKLQPMLEHRYDTAPINLALRESREATKLLRETLAADRKQRLYEKRKVRTCAQ
jgi:hypothetical protein